VEQPENAMRSILIWDIPTRLFHWLFAASFAGAWLTAESDQWLSVHAFLGYLMLGLIGFRLVWGFAGGHYARFASFLFSPMSGLAYLREMVAGKGARHLGHNPAGAQAIYLLLSLGLVVGVTGMFTLTGEEQQGGFGIPVSIEIGRLFKKIHESSATLMLAIVIGHIAGVVAESLLHKENLARSMVTGTKQASGAAPESKPGRWVGVLLALTVAIYGAGWFFYALHQPLEKRFGLGDIGAAHVAFVGPKLPDDPKWREECGSCHLAFHPNLLPARSWRRLMAEQESHFGSDLALDEATNRAVLAFMENNAAEKSNREAAFKIGRSLKPDEAPLRITETPYWVKKHRGIPEADWRRPSVKSKANCAACHLDADAGTFEDAAMRMPPKESPAK
jgi:cytochrome b